MSDAPKVNATTEELVHSLVLNGFGIRVTDAGSFDAKDPAWPLAWYLAFGWLLGTTSSHWFLVSYPESTHALYLCCDIADSLRLTDEQGHAMIGELQ